MKITKEFLQGMVAGGTIAFGSGVVIIEIINLLYPPKFDPASTIMGVMLIILGIIVYRYTKFQKSKPSTDPDEYMVK